MIGTRFQDRKQLRQYIILFAVAFRNIMIYRGDKAIRVPISFANKERFFDKINSKLYSDDPRKNPTANIEQVLPRISFNMTNLQYNPSRKIPSTSSVSIENPDGSMTAQFTPSPWKMDIEMSVYTRYEDDMLQIMEQIVPFFQPHITLEFGTELDYPPVKNRKVHIVLNGIEPEEDLFGDMDERRTLVWNYRFHIDPVFIYPPFAKTFEIHSVRLDFATGSTDLVDKVEYDQVDAEAIRDDLD